MRHVCDKKSTVEFHFIYYTVINTYFPHQFMASKCSICRRGEHNPLFTVPPFSPRLFTVRPRLQFFTVGRIFPIFSFFSFLFFRVRAEEVRVLMKASILKATNEAMFFVQPAVLSFFVFGTYYLLGHTLTPQKVKKTSSICFEKWTR